MKKKGFTLIELLAVIVILAIIALIASPIVIGLIDDAKKSSMVRSAESYLKAVEQALMKKNMTTEGTYSPSECSVGSNSITCNGDEISVEIDGDKPSSGEIKFENGKITDVELVYPDGTVIMDENDKLVVDDEEQVVIPAPVSFETDDWSTIVANAKIGNTSAYTVGSKKQITLSSSDSDIAGTYTVRVANNSTPSSCDDDEFSQTACGFVLEFENIISEHEMHTGGFSYGGWKASDMRTYINTDILNAFPDIIKNNIRNTRVVSSHETQKTDNYVTTDKIYLFSTTEIFGFPTDSPTKRDSAALQTRQLDYYSGLGVTEKIYTAAAKENKIWWLRTTSSVSNGVNYVVFEDGCWASDLVREPWGVSVAFLL